MAKYGMIIWILWYMGYWACIYIYNSSMMIRLYLKKTGCTHRSWQSFRQLLAISCKQINAPNLKSSTLCMYLPSGKLT